MGGVLHKSKGRKMQKNTYFFSKFQKSLSNMCSTCLRMSFSVGLFQYITLFDISNYSRSDLFSFFTSISSTIVERRI